jgi:hypothetical protein
MSIRFRAAPISQDWHGSRIDKIISVYAIRAWLARFVDTKATFDTYRKESERILLWSTTELRKPHSPPRASDRRL